MFAIFIGVYVSSQTCSFQRSIIIVWRFCVYKIWKKLKVQSKNYNYNRWGYI